MKSLPRRRSSVGTISAHVDARDFDGSPSTWKASGLIRQRPAAYYRMEGDVVVLIHTEVPFEYSGSGFATKLADGVFAILRERERKGAPRCAFMSRHAAQHPEH